MKLYYSKGACSLTVRIIMNELNIACDYESVDLKTKKTESGANYLEINPKGAVPAIVIDDGEVITENAVILQYLADTQKAYGLLPAVGNMKRYRVLEWLNYVTTEMHKGVGILFNGAIPQTIKDEIFIPLIKHKFTYLNQQLENKKYLVGNDFGLPDAYLFVILRWAVFFKFDLTMWPNLQRYFEGLKSYPAIKQSLAEEGL